MSPRVQSEPGFVRLDYFRITRDGEPARKDPAFVRMTVTYASCVVRSVLITLLPNSRPQPESG